MIKHNESEVEKNPKKKRDVITTKEDLANLRTDLMVELERTRSDIIKWMFLFWIGQLASLIAILQIFLAPYI